MPAPATGTSGDNKCAWFMGLTPDLVTEYFLPGTEPERMRNNPWNVPRWGPIIIP